MAGNYFGSTFAEQLEHVAEDLANDLKYLRQRRRELLDRVTEYDAQEIELLVAIQSTRAQAERLQAEQGEAEAK